MVKTKKEGSMNLGEVDPSLALLDLQRRYANKGAKRPADPNPTTNPPPAKRANTGDTFQLQVPGLRNVVRDMVHEELRKQLPDLLTKVLPGITTNALSDIMPKILPDLMTNVLSDLLPKALGERFEKIEEEIHQLREEREEDKAAHKKLAKKFEKSNKQACTCFHNMMDRADETEERLDALESAQTTNATDSEED